MILNGGSSGGDGGVRILRISIVYMLKCEFACVNEQMKTIQVAVSACVITFEVKNVLHIDCFTRREYDWKEGKKK